MPIAVLAYSGGLDTSVLVKLIKEKYNAGVVTVTIDVGQKEDLEVLKQKALYIGASEAYVIDKKAEFASEYLIPSLQANALYENAYPLATALARPLMAKALVDIVDRVGADFIAHGCTGKGNDQVRFESALACLAPHLAVLAPVREFSLSRDYEIEYAKNNNIPIEEKLSTYSIDENLWGRSIECGSLEDPDCEPPEGAFAWTKSPLNAPNYTAYLEIEFKHGVPVALNRKKMSFIQIISELNRIGGVHGVGRIDHIESRLVGIKSREVYEAPAALILIKAHQDLEKMTLTRDILHYKPQVENTFAELVYNGLWFSPLRHALSAFIADTQVHVTGSVKVKLYKGAIQVVGRNAAKSLYAKNLATYEEGDDFDTPAAKGFIELYALPYKVHAMVHRKQQSSVREKKYAGAEEKV